MIAVNLVPGRKRRTLYAVNTGSPERRSNLLYEDVVRTGHGKILGEPNSR